jgi:DNA-binding response OmpR family regulator
MNILVIDDEPLILNILKRTIQQKGHDVFLAHTVEEALQTLTHHPIDLIFTDLHLKEASATEVLQQFKSFCQRIVLMSGGSIQQEFPGILATFTKPFPLQDIHRLLLQTQNDLKKV